MIDREPLETTGLSLSLTSWGESNTHNLLGMVVAFPTPSCPRSLAYYYLLPGTHFHSWRVRTHPLVDPNIQLCWILERLSENKPKPKLPQVPGTCWINCHPREQRPSTPKTCNNNVLYPLILFIFHERERGMVLDYKTCLLTTGSSLQKMKYLSLANKSKRKWPPLMWQWTWRYIFPFTFFHCATTSSLCNLLYHPCSWKFNRIPTINQLWPLYYFKQKKSIWLQTVQKTKLQEFNMIRPMWPTSTDGQRIFLIQQKKRLQSYSVQWAATHAQPKHTLFFWYSLQRVTKMGLVHSAPSP